MFASDTLYELRVSLQLAETEREGVSFSLDSIEIVRCFLLSSRVLRLTFLHLLNHQTSAVCYNVPVTTSSHWSEKFFFPTVSTCQREFFLLSKDLDEIHINYPSIFELMFDLKGSLISFFKHSVCSRSIYSLTNK